MRYDKNFAYFVSHSDWYEFVVGKGYVPTEKAPPEAVKAIEEYNLYRFKEKK